MTAAKSWFSRLFSVEHRRSQRKPASGLVAYYWEGAAPMAHEVRNISSTGFYLLTKERWHPGTVVTMTLQKTAVADSNPELYIAVQTKVIRLGEDGIGFVFVQLEPHGADPGDGPTSRPVGKKALERFLDQLKSDQGHVTIGATTGRVSTKNAPSWQHLGGHAMNKLRDENGQALIITVLCMTCLLGFTALATDVGVMLREKRLAQTAADAAAIAGALEINYSSSTISNAGLAAAGQNGFTAASSGVTTAKGTTVTINYPPASGPHAGVANYVEAIATQKQPTIFMNLFGIGSMNVSARAVAENGGSSTGCVYVLSSNASPAMTLQGSFKVTAPNCGIVVDSTATNALCITGASGSLSAGSVGVVGGDSGGSCNSADKDSTPKPVTGMVAQSDPIISQDPGFTWPDPTKLTCTAPTGGVLTGTIPTPASGTACYSGNVTLNNVTFPTGTFVFTGNVTVNTSLTTASIANGGTALDINNGTFTVNTNTSLHMYGLQSNNGIVLMMPPTNSNTITIQFGNSTGTIEGIIYAPAGNLFLHDSGGDTGGGINLIADLVVGTLNDQTATLNITSYSQSTGKGLTRVMLVE